MSQDRWWLFSLPMLCDFLRSRLEPASLRKARSRSSPLQHTCLVILRRASFPQAARTQARVADIPWKSLLFPPSPIAQYRRNAFCPEWVPSVGFGLLALPYGLLRRTSSRSPTHQQNTALAPKSYWQSPRQDFDDQPTSDNDGARIGKRPEALPVTGGSFEPTASSVNEEANWVFIIRGAIAHSGPSVSAPIVRLYSVGTELHLTDYQHGWFQVLDPVTSQRGWIYEKYYLQAIRGPGQMVAALQEPAKAQQLNNPKPTPHVRRAKKIGPRPAKKVQPSIASASRHRYQTVASILDRALRP